MKKSINILLSLLLIPFGISEAGGKSDSLACRAAMLVDLDSGRVLYQQNADQIIQPASLTKIMSLYLIAEDIEKKKASYGDPVTISEKAIQTDGSKMFHESGGTYEVLELVKGMVIHSANDASVALAEYFAGSVEEFVIRMNAKAKELGMLNTHFVNPHGLSDKRQKTTARDISLLCREYVRRFPVMLKIHSIESFACRGEIFYNRNDLLQRYPGTNGLKTGYVASSGFHIVATVKRDERRLMAVVLGAKNPRIRSAQTIRLLDYGFQNSTGATEKISQKSEKPGSNLPAKR